jgi:hypothetical protein
MRHITSHKINGLNDALTIEVVDALSELIAPCRTYVIHGGDESHTNTKSYAQCVIRFQDGDPARAINGISNEALLAVVADRLAGFQASPHACRENAIALTHIQDAMHWLHHRTRERLQRGVEGTPCI